MAFINEEVNCNLQFLVRKYKNIEEFFQKQNIMKGIKAERDKLTFFYLDEDNAYLQGNNPYMSLMQYFHNWHALFYKQDINDQLKLPEVLEHIKKNELYFFNYKNRSICLYTPKSILYCTDDSPSRKHGVPLSSFGEDHHYYWLMLSSYDNNNKEYIIMQKDETLSPHDNIHKRTIKGLTENDTESSTLTRSLQMATLDSAPVEETYVLFGGFINRRIIFLFTKSHNFHTVYCETFPCSVKLNCSNEYEDITTLLLTPYKIIELLFLRYWLYFLIFDLIFVIILILFKFTKIANFFRKNFSKPQVFRSAKSVVPRATPEMERFPEMFGFKKYASKSNIKRKKSKIFRT